MFATAPAISVRPVAGQTTIGSDKAFFSFFRGRKLFLNSYKVDKTVSRLRYG
jgi:hypothetical protein